ncbi:MAG: hypothetical protein HQL69_22155 [Magnetococcales bacterium]|nr:hypothetical protein [Magnetococcales bacterium]
MGLLNRIFRFVSGLAKNDHAPKASSTGMTGETYSVPRTTGIGPKGKKMAFIYEKVPAEDQKRIDLSEINYPIDGYTRRFSVWVVDRENDVFLLYASAGGRASPGVQYFVLRWKGQYIRMRLRMIILHDENHNSICCWEKLQMIIPGSLKQEEGQIIENIKESLRVFGDFGNFAGISDIQFTF